MHVEQVSKNIGEHGRIQSLVETFTGQAARWWDTHQTRLQTWTTASTYFVKRFGGKVNPTSLDTCIHSRKEPKRSYQNL